MFSARNLVLFLLFGTLSFAFMLRSIKLPPVETESLNQRQKKMISFMIVFLWLSTLPFLSNFSEKLNDMPTIRILLWLLENIILAYIVIGPTRCKMQIRIALIMFMMIFSISSFNSSAGITCDYKENDARFKIAEYIRAHDVRENITVFSEDSLGSYMEFCGFLPFIDNRNEVFIAKNNHEYDYFGEYFYLLKGYIYYEDFFQKYKFDYIITTDTGSFVLDNALLHDKRYELLAEWDYRNIKGVKPVVYHLFKVKDNR